MDTKEKKAINNITGIFLIIASILAIWKFFTPILGFLYGGFPHDFSLVLYTTMLLISIVTLFFGLWLVVEKKNANV
ncbi:MAG: hypothetical protein WC659_03720 [Patescibacteria group bacterium]